MHDGIWNIASNSISPLPFLSNSTDFSYSSNDAHIISISPQIETPVSILSPLTSKIEYVYDSGYSQLTCLAVSPDGKHFATGGMNGIVTVWSIPDSALSNDNEKIAVDFTASRQYIQEGDTVHFSNMTFPSDTTLHYLWDFGDGEQSTLYEPNHVYRVSGNYSVNLSVTNDKLKKFYQNKANFVTVVKPITITFDTSSIVVHYNETVDFTPAVSASGRNYSVLWNFGNGNTSQSNTLHYVADQVGKFAFTYSVTGDMGFSMQYVKTIIVKQIAQILPTKPINLTRRDDILYLVGVNVEPNNRKYSIKWDFGDGAGSTEMQPSHEYDWAGQYTLKCAVTDVLTGLIDSTQRTLTVALKSDEKLLAISPNPITETSTFTCLGSGVTITVFDVLGKKVKELLDGTNEKGISFEWDGRDELGKKLPAGVYYCVPRSQNQTEIYPIILSF